MPIKPYKQFRREFAQRLQRERAVLGVTQAAMAEECDYTQQMISRYESGRVPRSLWFLANAAVAGYDVLYLLTGRRS